MAHHTHLLKRNGIYYCRIAVPTSLIKTIGRKEYWKSLGTKSYYDALDNLRMVTAEFFMTKGQLSKRKLQLEDIPIIAENYYNTLLSSHETQHQFMAETFDYEDKAAYDQLSIKTHQELIEELEEALKRGRPQVGEIIADKRLEAILVSKELFFEKSSHQYKSLCLALIHIRIKALKDINQRLINGWGDVPYATGKTKALADAISVNDPVIITTTKASAAPSKTLGELIEAINKSPSTQQKGKKMLEKFANYNRAILDITGKDKPVNLINRDFADNFFIEILRVPKSFYKKYKNQSLREYLDNNPVLIETGLSPSSLNDYLEHFSNLLKWGRKYGFSTEDVFDDLRVKEKEKSNYKRDYFEERELNILFGSKGIPRFKHNPQESHRYWIPLIGLLTGMRGGEIIQLKVRCIKKNQGIDYLSVKEEIEEGITVKTSASIKQIPISNLFKDLGFMEYVESVSGSGGDALLFPHVIIDKDKPFGWFSQVFKRELERLGIKTKKNCFHALRHTWTYYAENSGLSSSLIDSLGGWEPDGNERKRSYSKGGSLKRKLEAVNSINFEGVNLV